MPRPYKASPSGEAAARRRLMRAKFIFLTRQRVIVGNFPLIRPAATFPQGGRLYNGCCTVGVDARIDPRADASIRPYKWRAH